MSERIRLVHCHALTFLIGALVKTHRRLRYRCCWHSHVSPTLCNIIHRLRAHAQIHRFEIAQLFGASECLEPAPIQQLLFRLRLCFVEAALVTAEFNECPGKTFSVSMMKAKPIAAHSFCFMHFRLSACKTSWILSISVPPFSS